MAVYGSGGFAEIAGHTMGTYRSIASLPGEAFATAAPETFETRGFNMLTAELEAFAESIEAGRPFPTPLSEIRHGVAVFEAILRSETSGRCEPVAAGA